MNRRIFSIVVLFITTIIAINFSYSQDRTGANFLKIGVGPRQVGLGGAFTGVGDDIYTLYWNPAGIGFIRRWEFSAAVNQYFADMYYAAISGAKQFRILGSRKTGFGGGIFFHGMPDWDDTGGIDTEKGRAYNLYGLLSFGQRMDWLLDNFSLGINAKGGYSKLADQRAWLLASDFGAMYRFDVRNKPLTIGLAVQNIGFQTAFIKHRSPIPLGYRFGVSYRIFDCPWHHLLIGSDISKYESSNFRIGFGAEYWFHGIVSIRGGYNYSQDALGDISFGTSIRLDRFKYGTQLDFNQTDYGEVLGDKMSGAISFNSVSPEPFRLLSPGNDHLFCCDKINKLEWENTPDPDRCDMVTYHILIDPNEHRLRSAVDTICHSPEMKGDVIHLSTNDTQIQLSKISPNNYFWTVIAVDRGGHTRWSEEVRSFTVSAPDLRIRELAFIPSDTLPDVDDNYQGNIKLTIENASYCTAYNFSVFLSDSFCCDVQNKPFQEFHIDSLEAQQTIHRNFIWRTDEIGKHRFSAVVVPDTTTCELREDNNLKMCSAVTIPRGWVMAKKDTLETKKIEYTYLEIPIMPAVFFDSLSYEVGKDFYRQGWIHPYPVLKVIADRLKRNEELKIELAGYIDHYSEKGHNNLAHQRMKRVDSILVDILGVPSDQVSFKKNYDVTNPRANPRAIGPPEPMINEENRRVEIYSKRQNQDDEFELFRPIALNATEMADNSRITSGLEFKCQIKAYIDINCSQLIIFDSATRKTIFRTPFNNDPAYSSINIKGRAIWEGRDNENRLVDLRQPAPYLYSYLLKIQDKLGREFTTTPKNFYMKCDSIEVQSLQVHLDKFDLPEDYFSFNMNRLKKLAQENKISLKLGTLKSKIEGYACEIGTRGYNNKLAYRRAATSQQQLLNILEQGHEQWRIKAAGYNQPLKYYRPCTLGEIVYSENDAYIRNLNRRVEVILFHVEPLRKTAQELEN